MNKKNLSQSVNKLPTLIYGLILLSTILVLACSKSPTSTLTSKGDSSTTIPLGAKKVEQTSKPETKDQTKSVADTAEKTDNQETPERSLTPYHFVNHPGDPKFRLAQVGSVPMVEEFVSASGTWKPIYKIAKLPSKMKFYRWSAKGFSDLVDRNGNVPPDWVDHKVNEPDHGSKHGGGIYFSSNPFDSQLFGPNLSIMELEHDALCIDSREVLNSLHLNIDVEKEEALVNAGFAAVIRGLRTIGVHCLFFPKDTYSLLAEPNPAKVESWFNFFHPNALSNVRAETHPWKVGCHSILSDFLEGKKIDEKTLSSQCPIDEVINEIFFKESKSASAVDNSTARKIAQINRKWVKEAYDKMNKKDNFKTEAGYKIFQQKGKILGLQ